ncbi:hypothetical protein PGTUg99_029430 [Puccinia graminis f. sp. tritici]|uniref:Uncharacterized protein n=1 Tax=Puccinia graminis f. sp. tritici TaxID=56615 RepID=A0A5B0RWP7_PUCGR|nr:hypothetical protein PGTUg99_029430 [Puccinia graminis f. sp. tritici]
MITRTNTTANNVLPLSNPEAIIKAGNAKKRRSKHLPTQLIASLPSTSVTTSRIMSDAVPPTGSQEQPANFTRESTRTANGTDMSTAKEWFKAVVDCHHSQRISHTVLKVQHSTITQSQEDCRQALEDSNSDRIRRLEDLLLAMNIKNESGAQAKKPAPGRTKSVSNAANKIKILGNFIAETNLQSFYANKASSFLTKSWEEFKTFLEYSKQAQTLQSLFNFDAKKFSKLGDLQLAQFVVYGLPNALQDRINKRQLLEVAPFHYSPFEKQANTSFLAVQRPSELPTTSKAFSSAPPPIIWEEFLWRIHAYLDSQGLCNFCKKHCGNTSGTCPGPINRSRINITSTFQTPSKPSNLEISNYSTFRAWSKEGPTPGKPTHPPAGRPTAWAATVAGISTELPLEAQVSALTLDTAIREDNQFESKFDNEGYFPSLNTAALAALEDLDNQLLLNKIEKFTQADLADHIARG